jgi:hypothetical protein
LTLTKSENELIQTDFQIRVSQLRRLAENKYAPGAFDFTQDICAILSKDATGLSAIKNLVKMTLPNIWTTVEKMLHPCPYEVYNYRNLRSKSKIRSNPPQDKFAVDIEVPFGTDRKSLVAQMMPPGEYKTMFRLYNEKNQTVFEYNEHYMY